ncbi:hypothetical protein DFR52_102586 [Hoeflea marina]|uniref:Uncharacterized protein n=1 Tax=Hoeflea marina TaxID=274592 RepID=A0A317PNU2_9HYPH|nr:hypothetical protein DFR52_102586 [Hoeflea marina]
MLVQEFVAHPAIDGFNEPVATGFASLGLTFVLGPTVIGIAWISYRPLLGGLILIIGFVAAAAFFYFGKPISAAKTQEVPAAI